MLKGASDQRPDDACTNAEARELDSSEIFAAGIENWVHVDG